MTFIVFLDVRPLSAPLPPACCPSGMGIKSTSRMMRQLTRVDKLCVSRLLITFALPIAFSPPMPGRKRSIFTIFVKRPTRAPSLAMRAARAMTTWLPTSPMLWIKAWMPM